jgi:hypothetical protein
MSTQPPAPDLFLPYLAESVPKQDDEDLRALQDWLNDLLEYCRDLVFDA